MPNIDLSILNQRQTPAFFADTLANRPAAGFLGRIFVSTDTFAFYRDNGTGWDLIGGPGTGTITGSGANGQIALWNGTSTIVGDSGLTYDATANSLTASKFIVTGGTSTQFLKGDGTLDSNTYNTGSGAASQVAFFSGTNAITGENNLWWDSTNNHFGINTNTPGTALDIHHDQSTLVQLNQTTATNDTRLAFQNSGTALWRIGNFYNAGANDWGIFDVVGSAQQFSIKKTTGQTFVGAQTTSSGRLVVNNTTGDNHIVVIGATAPSLRINNSGSGATKQIGIGLATTTNNFIQGAADRDMAIFNSSTTASPILFGIYDGGLGNTQEAARISASRNLLIGTTTDTGQKLQVSGQTYLNSTATIVSFINTTNALGASNVYQQSGVNVGWVGNGSSSLIGGSTSDFTINGVNNLNLAVGGFRRGIIDSSGNFGLGTNPNPWGNNFRAYEGYNYLSMYSSPSGAGNSGISWNAYNDNTNWRYIYTGGSAMRYLINESNHSWYTSPAGSSGGVISFTQAMTLNSSTGNLLIGTTTDAGQKLQVNGTSYFSGNVGIGSVAPTAKLEIFEAGGAALTIGASVGTGFLYADNAAASVGTLTNTPIRLISNNTIRLTLKNTGVLNFASIPTSAVGLVSGDVYSNLGILTIVP